jgi:hypothetical protein
MAVRWPFPESWNLKGGYRCRFILVGWWISARWTHWRTFTYGRWRARFSEAHARRLTSGSYLVRSRRIELASLHKAFEKIQTEPEVASHNQWVALGCGVIRGFLTEEWFARHVMPEGKRSVLTVDETSAPTNALTLGRLIDLAEVLYNLQHIFGFDECLARLYEGNIEGTLAELDLGRMLYINAVPFRFIVPRGKLKSDYDTEIIYPSGLVACADAKCKIEGTEFTERKIRSVLNEAREQLPRHRPGIVFVKVPASWLNDPRFLEVAQTAAQRFLGGVKRIVSVKYYTSPIAWQNNYLMIQHAFKEYSNATTDFGNNMNWDIFKPGPLPFEWNGAPPWWQRIFRFPAEIAK